MRELNPISLDRDLRSAALTWRRFRRALREGQLPEDSPLTLHRRACEQSTFNALLDAPDDVFVHAARRWVFRLTEQRVNHAALSNVELAYRHSLHAFETPERGRLSLRALLHQALVDDHRRPSWLRTLSQAGSELARNSWVLWERRREVRERLTPQVGQPLDACTEDIEAVAEGWLSVTRRMWESFQKPTLSEYLSQVLGTKADEGWPARLTATRVAEWFKDTHVFTSLPMDPGTLPQVYGASSFQRAMARIGAAWVDAAAPQNQPFVVAHDAYGLKRRTVGALFAFMTGLPSFLQRQLGLSRPQVRTHRRALALSVLAHSRAQAFRVLCRPLALQGERLYKRKVEELAYSVFGFPLHAHDFGLVFRLYDDDAQRLSGLLLGQAMLKEFIQTHDEDFYRNPRAVDALRSWGCLPPEAFTTAAALDAGKQALLDELTLALS